MNRFKWLPILLLSLNIISGVALLLALSSAYVNPIKWWLPSLAGLAYPQILLLNVLFFILWLFLSKRFMLVSLIFLVPGLVEFPNHFQINFPELPWNREIKIMSLNVRNFDLYNWSANKKTRDKILHVIKSRDAEIICLQEFFNTTDPKHDFKTLDTILEFENDYNSHVQYTATVKETEHWGIATFTNFPIVGKGVVEFTDSSHNVCIYTDVNIGYRTYRVYNMHLASVRFGQEDYKYLEEVVQEGKDPNVNSSKNLLNKLHNAFERRAIQVDLIRAHMNKSPYPIIVCGDFNDTPTSYSYYQISKGLNDTFKMKGKGFGSTYNGSLPYLRIDYIFTDPVFKILNHEVINANISDHYPICTSVEIKD